MRFRPIATVLLTGPLLAGGLAACVPAAPEEPAPVVDPDAPPAAPPATAAVLPAGTDIQLVLNERLTADSSRIGDRFTATVRAAIIAQNGEAVLAPGTIVTGMVTGVVGSDSIGSQAAIRLNFLRIRVDDVTHPFTAGIRAVRIEPDGPASSGVVEEAGARAAAGAVIAGDLRDALVAAALSTGAGTIVSLGTGNVDPALPAGTILTVRNRDTLRLRDR